MAANNHRRETAMPPPTITRNRFLSIQTVAVRGAAVSQPKTGSPQTRDAGNEALKRAPGLLPGSAQAQRGSPSEAGMDATEKLRKLLPGTEAALAAMRGAGQASAVAAATKAERVKDVSSPMQMSELADGLREKLILQMAEQFSPLWGKDDPGLETPEIAAKTLRAMVHDPSVVFQVQYDKAGRLASTSTIVDRDEPRFDNTGPNGTDRYGDHWVANVYTAPAKRGCGLATNQIKSLADVATGKGWPHLYLYCRDKSEGVDLPKYYNEKLAFNKVGEEQSEGEKENIMRFDTGVA